MSFRPISWYGYRRPVFLARPITTNTNVQNTTNISAYATGGSTVSVNVNQSSIINNSVTSGAYFAYYYPRKWW